MSDIPPQKVDPGAWSHATDKQAVKGDPCLVRLSPEHLALFDRDGFLVIPKALDCDAIEELIDTGDRLMASNRQGDRLGRIDNRTGFRDCVALDDCFLRLLTYCKTFPLVVQMLGPNIHLVSSMLLYLESLEPGAYRTTRTPANPGWHRDVYGVDTDLGHPNIPRLAIKCAYYLTDVSEPGSGMTLFLPGSHRLKANLAIPPGAIDPHGALQLRLNPGDAVLFENRTFHVRGINESGRTRKTVMMQYGFRWVKPIDYVLQPTTIFERCSPIQRQLLGESDRNAEGRTILGRGARALKDWCAKHQIDYEPAQ